MAATMISADDHSDLGYLPAELFLERLPAALKDRGPHVEEKNGKDMWVCEGATWGDWRGGKWAQEQNRIKVALDRVAFSGNFGIRPTTTDLRLEDMDRDGVHFSVMYPPIFGMRLEDKELGVAVIRAYNDWAIDFERSAPDRFRIVAQMLPDDPDGSVDELLRCAAMGVNQVNFLVGTVTAAMYQPSWDKFWAAAEANNIVVNYHVGGPNRAGAFSPAGPSSVEDLRKPGFGMGLGDGATVFLQPFIGLFSFGILERHPNLRLVLAESGTGWIPFQVQEMDYRFNRVLEGKVPEHFSLKKLPSEVFKKQVWATYQQDFVGLNLIPFFGDGHMMWASDYPHPDSTWPDSVAILDKEMATLDPAMRQKITHDNAKEFYNL
ncbi:MAG: amidohydrolase [Chloroflexi bacterium]|nr:amidohydrolase [Chloroflexota bacterium]